MTEEEVKHARGALENVVVGTVGAVSAMDDIFEEVTRLHAERTNLRELAKAVKDYWRHNLSTTRDGISTPGMRLLLAVLK